MPGYVTRVTVWCSSEGASPAAVMKRLLDLGFTPVRGAYDFIYEHEGEISESDLGSAIIEISKALHKALAGFNVLYTLDTHPKEEDENYIPLEDIDAELKSTRKEIDDIEHEISQHK